MRIRILLTTALLAAAGTAHAAPLEGFGIGGGLASNSLDAETDFSGYPSSANGDDTGGSLFLKGDWMGRSGGFGYRFGLLLQGGNLSTSLFADDEFEVKRIATIDADLGYAAPPHFVFGVVELGSARVAHIDDNYGRTEESVGVAGLGVGYTYALTDHVELTAELLGRVLSQLEINYSGGALDGEHQTVDATVGSLLLGASYRF
ncbi:MAG TPA: outer membrane beta-barrel protein [Gammaproteobacteria bacterium]|nr:outer membrane beta-barrel protein [Gammaproteobacteria bacterium]